LVSENVSSEKDKLHIVVTCERKGGKQARCEVPGGFMYLCFIANAETH
jgi:hypothetical protein